MREIDEDDFTRKFKIGSLFFMDLTRIFLLLQNIKKLTTLSYIT